MNHITWIEWLTDCPTYNIFPNHLDFSTHKFVIKKDKYLTFKNIILKKYYIGGNIKIYKFLRIVFSKSKLQWENRVSKK
jgi:hypothetical protein